MRSDILNIAKKQMKLGGYENLSFAKIAEELSTTRANLHYHFKNKETLALETTKLYADEHLETFKNISSESRGDFYGFIRAIEGEFWRDAFDAGDCGVCVCTQLIREFDPPQSIKGFSQQHFFDIQEIFIKHIITAIESGQLKKDIDPQILGAQCGAFMMGMMSMSSVFPTVQEAKANLEGIVENWLEGIKKLNK